MSNIGPLWNQVAARLRKRIEGGYYEVGGILPREIDLAEELAVSRNTVREAIRKLVDEGLLIRRRRAGTRVLAKRPVLKMRIDLDPQASLLKLSKGTRLVVKRRVTKPLPEDIAEYWSDADPGDWHRVDCLRTYDDSRPLSWTQIFLAPDLEEVSLLVGQRPGQQFRLIEEHRGERMRRTRTAVFPVKIDAALAKTLNVTTGVLGLKVMHGMLNELGVCREIVVSVYPTERYAFELSFNLYQAMEGQDDGTTVD